MGKRNRTDEEGDRALTDELVFRPCGMWLDPIYAENGKTPDFRVITYHGLAAFCEMKSPRDDDLEDRLLDEREKHPDEPVAEAAIFRVDPTFKRLARQVRSAVEQFDAVNVDRSVANILLFVNHAQGRHAGDLRETITGYLHATSGGRYPTQTRIASQLSQYTARIDLYIWLDRRKRGAPELLFAKVDDGHDRTLRAAFRPLFWKKD